jgi:hypothetical protein
MLFVQFIRELKNFSATPDPENVGSLESISRPTPDLKLFCLAGSLHLLIGAFTEL